MDMPAQLFWHLINVLFPEKGKKKPEKFRTLALEQNIYTVVQTDITAGVVFKKKKKS